jgi:hypothetical protein
VSPAASATSPRRVRVPTVGYGALPRQGVLRAAGGVYVPAVRWVIREACQGNLEFQDISQEQI